VFLSKAISYVILFDLIHFGTEWQFFLIIFIWS